MATNGQNGSNLTENHNREIASGLRNSCNTGSVYIAGTRKLIGCQWKKKWQHLKENPPTTNKATDSPGFYEGRKAYLCNDRRLKENPFEPGSYEYEGFWDGWCFERDKATEPKEV